MAAERAHRGGRPRTQGWVEDPLVTVSVHLRKSQLALLDHLADEEPSWCVRPSICCSNASNARDRGTRQAY